MINNMDQISRRVSDSGQNTGPGLGFLNRPAQDARRKAPALRDWKNYVSQHLAFFGRLTFALLNGFLLAMAPMHGVASISSPCWPEHVPDLPAQSAFDTSMCDSLISFDAVSEQEAIMVVNLSYIDLRRVALYSRSAKARWRLASVQVRPRSSGPTVQYTEAGQPDPVEATLRWIRVREQVGERQPSSGAGASEQRQ
jgi:hypothetical protein